MVGFLCLVSVATMVLTIPYTVARPCSSKECLEARMPLVSDNLKAPLIAELDVSTLNLQLKEYIDDNINYTFSHTMEKGDLEWKHNITEYIESVIDLKISKLERRINEQSEAQILISENLTEVVREHSQKVGFTVKSGRVISGGLIEFGDIKTSYGLSMDSAYTGGVFNVYIPGYYLITVSILATEDAGFDIKINDKLINYAVVHWTGTHYGYHSASASAFVKLSVGDKVTIVGFRIAQLESTSSMTVVKI